MKMIKCLKEKAIAEVISAQLYIWLHLKYHKIKNIVISIIRLIKKHASRVHI